MLLITYIVCRGDFAKHGYLDAVWFDDNLIVYHNGQPHLWPSFKKEVLDRKYVSIDLDGAGAKNTLKINELKKRIDKMKSDKDTSTVYKVNFTQRTTYADMVEIVELGRLNDNAGIISILYRDNAYFFHTKPPVKPVKERPEARDFYCGTMNSVPRRDVVELSWFDEFKIFTKTLKELWPSLIFLVLMALSVKFNPNKASGNSA